VLRLRSREELERLIAQWRPLSVKVARSFGRTSLGGRLDFAELEAAALVGLWQLLSSWDEDSSPGPFLCSALPWKMTEYLRTHGPRHYRSGRARYEERQLSQLADPRKRGHLYDVADDRYPLTAVDARDEAEAMLSAVPQPERDMLRLYFFDGLTLKEVGDRYGLHLTTVSHRLMVVAREHGGSWGDGIKRAGDRQKTVYAKR
jgi:RNA polymerase sigma factor (sigma-70 family)